MKTSDKSKCVCFFFYGSTALVGLGRFFSSLIYTQSVGFLDGGSALRKTAIYTQNNTNTEDMHTDIHAFSGIRTHYSSVRANEDS
jgi:hypothetical protein